MLFVEARFFAFFLLVLVLYWNLPTNRQRKYLLLIASYVFYGAWDYRFLSLILLTTIIDYLVALTIAASTVERTRRHWLTVSLASNLGILFFFKYFNFFADSLSVLLTTAGIPVNQTTLNIVLPVGISFYTFQTMSYTIDVYRRRLQPRRDLLDVALFVAFFPQLVAGPIVRASDFLPQLDRERRWAEVAVKACILMFLVGYIKKAVISDNLAPYVDMLFADPAAFRSQAVALGVTLYGIQIYCDFSGYSEMAIAIAGLLGYRLPRNFDAPYLATDVTDFWRRWHISLSGWLRDYLYISLGGNRGGRWTTYRNIVLTMLLGGLWHGAAWTFVVWGLMHGLALVVHKAWTNARARHALPAVPAVLGLALTFYWVSVAWIFFRAADFVTAWTLVRGYVLLQSNGAADFPALLYFLVAALAAIHTAWHLLHVRDRLRKLPDASFAVLGGTAAGFAAACVPSGYQPFIYFQF